MGASPDSAQIQDVVAEQPKAADLQNVT